MTMNLKSWGLLTLTLVLPSCLLDFDGYRERPADGGNGAAGNAGGNGGAANGASGGDGGSAAGGSGNAGGSGGSTAGGSGGDAGVGNAGSGGTGNVAGSSGAAGNGGDGCLPHDPEPVCGQGKSCQFKMVTFPYDYTTLCESAGTGVGVGGCSDGDSSMCAPGRFCMTGRECLLWCRIGSDDCAACNGTCFELGTTPVIGGIKYGLCSTAC